MAQGQDYQQKLSHPSPMGMPPGMSATHQTTGVARAVAFARGVTGQAFGLAVIVFALQALMPQGSKPSDLIGSFHGSTRTAELDAERIAQITTAHGMANAQAAAPANWQMEQQLSQTQQQMIAGSLETQTTVANVADAACIGSGLVSLFFGRDGEQAAQVLGGACGVGDKIRANITDTLSNTARQGSGVMQRSAPVQQATQPYQAVQPNGRPVPVAAPQR